MKYRTKDGDVLARICAKHYGGTDQVADVIAANPGLAERGAVLDAGIIIHLPPVEDKSRPRPTIRLWD